jgi:hypothetical protein
MFELTLKGIELQRETEDRMEVTGEVYVGPDGVSLTVLRAGSYHHHIDLEIQPDGRLTLAIRPHGAGEENIRQTIHLFDSAWPVEARAENSDEPRPHEMNSRAQ